jgi:hypothetical protein
MYTYIKDTCCTIVGELERIVLGWWYLMEAVVLCTYSPFQHQVHHTRYKSDIVCINWDAI